MHSKLLGKARVLVTRNYSKNCTATVSAGLMEAALQVDWCPILRHLFHWLNGVPASKETVHKILKAGGSVVVVPGGVHLFGSFHISQMG